MLNIKKTDDDVTVTISKKAVEDFIEAVIFGKYSWACVIIFKSLGYNPLDYIPYRTYNRLLKESKKFNDETEGMSTIQKIKLMEEKKKRNKKEKEKDIPKKPRRVSKR